MTAVVSDPAPRDSARLRRFVLTAVVFAVVFTAVGRVYGQDIALELQKTPTTVLGWRLAGWLLSGPPLLVALVLWHERGRLAPGQWSNRSTLVAAWIGANMLVLPTLVRGVGGQFGTGALVGDPLAAGWAWGAVATVVGVVLSGVVLVVLHRTVADPTAEQRDLTVRFLERAWVVVLVASVGFALYGGR